MFSRTSFLGACFIALLAMLAPFRALGSETAADDSAFIAAKALFDARRYAEAQPAFEALIVESPNDPQVLLHLGKLAAKRRERALAIDYFARAVALAPDNAELQFEYGAASSLYADTLGVSFKAMGAARHGRIAVERAVELDPENLIYRQGLLEFYSSAPVIVGGSMRKAYEQADAIAARDAIQGAFARANLQRAENDLPAALVTLAELITRAPANYFALFQYGRTAAESGQHLEPGLQALQHCLELPPPDKGAPPAQVWWRIGQIQARRGDSEAARAAFVSSLALAPNDEKVTADLAALPAPASPTDASSVPPPASPSESHR